MNAYGELKKTALGCLAEVWILKPLGPLSHPGFDGGERAGGMRGKSEQGCFSQPLMNAHIR
jgi:hypothetical protein